MVDWYTSNLEDRFQAAADRIMGLAAWNGKCQNPAMTDYFAESAGSLAEIVFYAKNRLAKNKGVPSEDESIQAKKNRQARIFAGTLPENYGKSYLNPEYAVQQLGMECGQVLSAIYADMLSAYPYAAECRLLPVVVLLEFYLGIYDVVCSNLGDGRADLAKVLKARMKEFYLEFAPFVYRNYVLQQVDAEEGYIQKWALGADISTPDYLYDCGFYVGEDELGLWQYLSSLSEERIQEMADIYTEGYRIGFEVTRKDLSKKKTVELEYPIGFERVIRKAVANFAKMGLSCSMRREPQLSIIGRGSSRWAVYSVSLDRQFLFDHKEDKALYMDRGFVERRLEALETVYEECAAFCRDYAGPAVVDVFGEARFEPVNKAAAAAFSREQNEICVLERSSVSALSNRYISGEETSFTIIAWPLPSIADAKDALYRKIFDETFRLNTLDYRKYQDMQQKLIDILDQGTRVYIQGKGDNQTDMTVSLCSIDPDKETKFENCVADVNIPVGEVFTSPVLKGTNGLLHVSEVYIRDFHFKNLKLYFEDGMVKDYSCENFDDPEQNRRFVADHILFKHAALPLGEFAIGTNTTAYRMARDYRIQDKLPILIAEKTGPHFAVGDTCYAHSEDVAVFNPDGKEIIARDNEVSILRKEDVSRAYFNCHTDITIPFEELGKIEVATEQGERLAVIRDGKFVVEGCEELNVPLEGLAY